MDIFLLCWGHLFAADGVHAYSERCVLNVPPQDSFTADIIEVKPAYMLSATDAIDVYIYMYI